MNFLSLEELGWSQDWENFVTVDLPLFVVVIPNFLGRIADCWKVRIVPKFESMCMYSLWLHCPPLGWFSLRLMCFVFVGWPELEIFVWSILNDCHACPALSNLFHFLDLTFKSSNEVVPDISTSLGEIVWWCCWLRWGFWIAKLCRIGI